MPVEEKVNCNTITKKWPSLLYNLLQNIFIKNIIKLKIYIYWRFINNVFCRLKNVWQFLTFLTLNSFTSWTLRQTQCLSGLNCKTFARFQRCKLYYYYYYYTILKNTYFCSWPQDKSIYVSASYTISIYCIGLSEADLMFTNKYKSTTAIPGNLKNQNQELQLLL